MPDDGKLYLLKIPLRADRLASIARRRQIPLTSLDDGYLVHCVLRELWPNIAPAPFVLRAHGRLVDTWGYSRAAANELVDHARSFADPALVDVIDRLDDIASKEMPTFRSGRRIGFNLRACPVVRLASGRHGHRAGAEVDAFLARCFAEGSDVTVSRDEVYRRWLHERLADPARTGATVERIRLAGFARERFVRRTQGAKRKAHRLERPDVRFEGDLMIEDGSRFLRFLSHGVGRHRAFGFGALIVVPPGTPYLQ